MTLPIIDFVFFVIVFAFAIIGWLKGFINELFSKGAPVVGVWVSVLFYKSLAVHLLSYVKFAALANIFAFVIIFILAFLIVKVIQTLIGSVFSGAAFRQLDRTLGFVFGLLEGLAVVALILLLLTWQPWFNVSSIIDGSIFYSFFLSFISNVKNMDSSVPTAYIKGTIFHRGMNV